MFNSPTCNEISQPVVAPPGCMFDELTAATSIGDSSAELKSLLFEWFHQQECGTRRIQEKQATTRPREINTPPQEVNEWAHKQERGTEPTQEMCTDTWACQTETPLQKASAGPWVSLGGYFDYSNWADRERFVQLDRAIAKSDDLSEISTDPF
jgi:hypothetical protein